jgi:hypothetical protein
MTLATGESETADAAATSAKLGTTTNPFPGFTAETVKTSGTTIHVLRNAGQRYTSSSLR